MMDWLRRTLSRITGVSTPLGGISWSPTASSEKTVQTFSEEIFITSCGNREFISFLEANDGRIVFLKTHLDASVATREQHELVEKEAVDIDRIASCSFDGMPLPLPNEDGNLVSVAFNFSEHHVLNYSAGGTGVVMVGITGFFEISRTFHGGPSMIFHLREFDAPLEFRVDFINSGEG